MDENENSNANPFDLFVSECTDVDIEVRINSIKKLPIVAVALDTERTKTQLIPYLDALTEGLYNDDEVLLNLAEQLGNFLPFVGSSENAHLILDVLEKLASIEENVVREEAIKSLHKIAISLDAASLENIFVPLVFRLSEAEWFTSKSASTALFAICYPKLSQDHKTDMRNAYRVLCQDDSPLVRRSAATKLTEFAKVLEVHHLKDEFIPVFDNFSKDDQDSVRVLAVDVGISIASRLKKKEVEDFILTTIAELCGDASWRVRYQVANQINAIQVVLGHELTRKYLVPMYQNLVNDTEPQVREACAIAIVRFSQILQKTFKESDEDIQDAIDPIILNEMFPLIQCLDQDTNPEVKESLALVVTSLSPLLGAENTKNFLLPLITNSLMNDSSRVRENIIANLNNIISVIGISDIADTVLKIVIDLVNNSASVWRTRRNLIVTINYIAKHSGKEYFDENLKTLYQKLLSDGVYAVRKTAPLILPILVKNFGFAWASSSMVPVFLVFAEHKHYLYRFVCLFCIDELVTPTLEAKFESATTVDDIQSKNRLKYLQRVRDIVLQGCDEEMRNTVTDLLKRVGRLNDSLRAKLEEKWVVDALRELEKDDICDDDIKQYAEDTIDMFIKDNNLDISSVSKEEIGLQGNNIYLEGLLDVIANKCLNVIKSLSKDPVLNIRLKVAKTLKNILQFNKTLQAELDEAWARELAPDKNEEKCVAADEEQMELNFELAKVEDDQILMAEENKGQKEILLNLVEVDEKHDATQEEGKGQKEIIEKTKQVVDENENQTSKAASASASPSGNENKTEPGDKLEIAAVKEAEIGKSMEMEIMEILDEKLSAEKGSSNNQPNKQEAT